MDVLKLKMEVLEKVMQTEDEDLLGQLKDLLSRGTKSKDFADDLTDEQWNEVNASLKELEEGRGIPWEEAMKTLGVKK